ncbi:MAG: hemolysin family protein [Erysipelotrichaceae bacterium]|nr:hemolysin family protein [Erysipelotrichaceae bacterium]MDP3304661.1 hemolysin family protein [Erysipelotrichaceae bacterium]
MEILFLVILTSVNAFLSAAEIALISLNDNKIKVMAEDGHKKARQLLKLLGEPSRFLATIQIGITLAGFLASAFAADTFAEPLVALIKQTNVQLSDSFLRIVTVFMITLVLSYFTLVFGELVPKRIAMTKAEPVAFAVVPALLVLSTITYPFVKLLTFSTNVIVSMFGIDPHASQGNVTEEEIRMMVDVGEEKGTIQQREKMMINNIFEFNNKEAEDIMTHRMELFSLPVSASLDDIVEMIHQEKFTRIPVFEDNIDDIIGILHVKDLIPLINTKSVESFSLKDNIRKPYFVPTSKKIDELFVDLQLAKTHIAIVIDEYGGTAGIVTIEDLVEEIVGNIFDEYDEELVDFKKLTDDTYEVSGMMNLEELEERFEVGFPTDEYETLSGFMISLIGKIPESDDVSEVIFRNLHFKIAQVTEKRIEKVILTVLPTLENEDDED